MRCFVQPQVKALPVFQDQGLKRLAMHKAGAPEGSLDHLIKDTCPYKTKEAVVVAWMARHRRDYFASLKEHCPAARGV